MEIQITIEDGQVRAELGRLAGRLRNLTPAMRGIGEIVRTSVERNFAEVGRPNKWEKSKRVKEKGGQTLSDTGRLRRSFTVRGYKDRAEVGTNVRYAAIHQLGFDGNINIGAHTRKVKSRDVFGKIDIAGVLKRRKVAKGIGFVRAHTRHMTMPARPFLMVQNEDWPKMRNYLAGYIVEGNA